MSQFPRVSTCFCWVSFCSVLLTWESTIFGSFPLSPHQASGFGAGGIIGSETWDRKLWIGSTVYTNDIETVPRLLRHEETHDFQLLGMENTQQKICHFGGCTPKVFAAVLQLSLILNCCVALWQHECYYFNANALAHRIHSVFNCPKATKYAVRFYRTSIHKWWIHLDVCIYNYIHIYTSCIWYGMILIVIWYYTILTIIMIYIMC